MPRRCGDFATTAATARAALNAAAIKANVDSDVTADGLHRSRNEVISNASD